MHLHINQFPINNLLKLITSYTRYSIYSYYNWITLIVLISENNIRKTI
jgi:hypothetical protein